MDRPARVRIRRRNPWVFARRRLFGWKVRLLTLVSHLEAGRGGPVFGGGRLPSEAHDRTRAAPLRGRGSWACENSRPTGPSTVRESGTEGQTSGSVSPAAQNAIGSHRARPASRSDTPSAPTQGSPQSVDNHVDGGGVPDVGRRRRARRGTGRRGRRVADATMAQLWRTTL